MGRSQSKIDVTDLQCRLDEHPEQCREVYLELTRRITRLQENGEAVPDCFAHLERSLLTEFRAESQGR